MSKTLGELAKELSSLNDAEPNDVLLEAAEKLVEVEAVLLALQRAGSLADYIGDSYEDGPAKAKARAFIRNAIEGKEP